MTSNHESSPGSVGRYVFEYVGFAPVVDPFVALAAPRVVGTLFYDAGPSWSELVSHLPLLLQLLLTHLSHPLSI